MKAIVIIRTSTDRQEVESQRKVVTEYAIRDGFSPEDLIIIGEAGASAIKLDDAYLRNMSAINSLISSESVSCVYAFALDRIGRNDEVLVKFKNSLISHKIQLKIINPTLQLLNEDGSVNSGMELALSLFITLSKQEMENKKARFLRGKNRNREEGKFNGGGILPFGYSVDSNGHFVINEEQAEVIRLMFNLYATGNYSNYSLANELTSRGYRRPNPKGEDKPFTYTWVGRLLRESYFCGRGNKPAIISEELFDICSSLRERKYSPTFSCARAIHLCNGLIKCPDCGHTYTYAAGTYRCMYRSIVRDHYCSNSLTISAIALDRLIWEMTKFCYNEESAANAPKITNLLKEEISILNSKIESSKEQEIKSEYKLERLKELYINGDYSKEEYETQKTKLTSELSNILSTIQGYKTEISLKEDRINLVKHFSPTSDLDNYSNEEKRKLVLKYFNNIEVHKEGSKRLVSVSYNIYGQEIKANVWNFIYYPFCYDLDKPNMFRLPTAYEENFQHITEPIPLGHYGSKKVTKFSD